MIARRGFLRRMMATPLLARQAAEQVGRELAGIGGGCIPGHDLRDELRPHAGVEISAQNIPQSGQTGGPTDWQILQKARDDLILKALATPKKRAELEARLFQLNRQVYGLDPDLAFNRSIAPQQKIVFQRQRNVARDIEYTIKEKTPREAVRDWKRSVLNILGINV